MDVERRRRSSGRARWRTSVTLAGTRACVCGDFGDCSHTGRGWQLGSARRAVLAKSVRCRRRVAGSDTICAWGRAWGHCSMCAGCRQPEYRHRLERLT